ILPLTVGVFLTALDTTIVVSSYASIGSQFNQLQNTSWIASGYVLTVTSFQPLYGKLSDIFGRKPCLLMAYTLFGLGCLLCGVANDMNCLIAARALTGIGGGGILTVGSIIVSDMVPLRSRGTWQGVLNVIFATGQVTGAPLGGALADGIGWRWVFLVQVPLTLAAFLSVSFALRLPVKTSQVSFYSRLKRVDFAGAAALVTSILFLLLGLDRGGNVSWGDNLTVSFLIASALLFFLLAIVEFKFAKEPFAPAKIILSPSLAGPFMCNFCGVMSFMCIFYQISLYFQAVRNMTASQASLGLLPTIFAGTLGSLAGGLLIQATGKYYVLTVCTYGVMLLGTVFIVLFTGYGGYSLAGIITGLILMSLGNGTGVTTTLVALIANAGPEDQAVAIAVSYLYRSLGQIIGISAGSTLIQNKLRNLLAQHLVSRSLDIEQVARRVRESLEFINQLDPDVRVVVRQSYRDAFPSAFWFSVAAAAAAFFASFCIKEKSLMKSSQS
ncbi:MFS general substrate transporter, partial [Neolentinus lepideus HHB14362 ss-1]